MLRRWETLLHRHVLCAKSYDRSTFCGPARAFKTSHKRLGKLGQVASLEVSLLKASSIDRCLVAVEHCQAHIPSMGEHESTAKKILHKLKPGHHKDSPDTMDLTQGTKKEDKPLVEQSEHIHSHASHPHIESCAPLLLFCVKIASQAFRCPLLAHHLQLSCHFLPCLLDFHLGQWLLLLEWAPHQQTLGFLHHAE